ncbi:MAG: TolC family protein, partial [Planctomycetota bacterium]
ALRLATDRNRSFKSEVEDTQLAALSVSLQRRNLGPVITNTIAYVFSNSPSADAAGTTSARIGISKIVPSGGTVSASTGGAAADTYEGGAATTYSHDVTVGFEQPLLKGFGREVSHESLTQAERNAVYALRDFELFRQSFSIEVLRKYYDILNQKQVVKNSRQNLERYEFLKRRSEALFDVGKVTATDKFRAEQSELTASNTLLSEQERLDALLDDFKVFLDLSTDTKLDVEDMQPVMEPVNIDLKSAIAAGLYNRLDIKTSAERLEDAERGVRIARNGLLPDLNLAASTSVAGTNTGADWSYGGMHSAGIELVLPLDKVADRNNYKRALIDRDRSKRALSLAVEDTKVQVMNTYRRLRRLANSVRIERANVILATKRLENAKVRFEAGELGNRDVVEAQVDLLRAQNALVEAILDHEVARLQLKKDIGILFIGPDGRWKE